MRTIEELIQDIEESFDVRRLNPISSVTKRDDIDFFVRGEDVPNIVARLSKEKCIFRLLPNRGVVGYTFINGELYDLDFAHSCQSLLMFFPKRYFKDAFYVKIWDDPNLEKFMRYTLQFRNRKPKYIDFVENQFDKYGIYLANDKYLNKATHRASVTARDVIGTMERKWFYFIKTFSISTLGSLVYVAIRRKIDRIGAGHIIAFVGADGSGKTTAIDKIKYICTGRVYVLGDGSLYLSSFYAVLDRQHIAIARLKYIGIFIEQWLRYIWIWLLKMRGETILLDRWPGTNRHLRHNNVWRDVNNALYRCFPNPDIFIFLAAEPEEIRARKPELTIEEIRCLQENLRTKLSNTRYVEIKTQDFDTSLIQILDTVLREQGELMITQPLTKICTKI